MSEVKSKKRLTLGDAIGTVVILAILFFVFQACIWVIQFYWNTVQTHWKEKPVQVILTVFIACVALGLALFKRWSLQIYAMIELSFGFNVLWESADKIVENPGNSTLVGASAYLLARGFNNLFDSWKKIDARSAHPVLEERAEHRQTEKRHAVSVNENQGLG